MACSRGTTHSTWATGTTPSLGTTAETTTASNTRLFLCKRQSRCGHYAVGSRWPPATTSAHPLSRPCALDLGTSPSGHQAPSHQPRKQREAPKPDQAHLE